MKNIGKGGNASGVKSTKNHKKQRKQRKERPVLRKVLTSISVVFTIGIVCALVAVGYVFNFANEYINGEKKIDLDTYKANQAQTSIIYAYDSNKQLVELLRLHGEENRVWIEYDEIPQDMIDAFRDLEDKRFEEHQGVDWTRTILGVAKSGFEQGGSTITQQLIKNLTGEDGRMASRKFYEILNALNLERYYHKKAIMESYLNTVYLGNGCYGIKTAAEVYFGKNVEDLNAAECATIASITKAPGTYDPLTEPEENKSRQEYCLYCMLEQGSITQAEYDEAIDFELIYTNSDNYKGSQVTKEENEEDKEYTEEEMKEIAKDNATSSYYVEYVIDNVIDDLMDEYDLTYNEAWKKVFFGGLRIYSAVDMDVQSAAEDVYLNRVTFPNEEDTEENPAVQSAITIMDYNGRVVAMVGGAGEKDAFRGLNRAAHSPRQPGSSIKPISVYAPAIEMDKATWSTMVQNYGIKMGSSRWPVNYGGNAGSPNSFCTVQYALQVSYNTVPAQIAAKIGLEPCLDFLVDDLKFTTLVSDEDDPDYDGNYSSICVGGMSQGVTTLEMTAAFAIFGNNGYYYEPYSYYKVTNNDGSEVLLESADNAGNQVVSESTAGVMRQLLRTVVTSGTGGGYGVSGFETFAKTGTTSDDKDRWFVGGTPYYVAAVWYGYDQPRPIRNTSGNPAGKIFKKVMDAAHDGLDDLDFPTASGVVARRYCTVSGDIANSGCPSATGYYKSSCIPNRCKGCSLVNAIGQGLPDVIYRSPSTTGPSDPDASTTRPVSGNSGTTSNRLTTSDSGFSSVAPPVTAAPPTQVSPPVEDTQPTPPPTQAPEIQPPATTPAEAAEVIEE